MDKGDFTGDFAKSSVCPQRKAVLLRGVAREEEPREAWRNAPVLTLGDASDFIGLNVCTGLPKPKRCQTGILQSVASCKALCTGLCALFA